MASARGREPRSPAGPPGGSTASAWIDSPRAWAMYALAALAYAIAVMQRTSFGVAGVLAMDRFSAGASVVSLFVVVQMLTYAGMQMPVGVLADRFGSRLVVGLGAVLMCVGQLDLAFSTNLAAGIFARVLVGCGDAMTFTAVLRMLPAWFSRRRIPILNQVTSMLGQGGQLLSSIPLAALLGVAGWTTSFLAAGLASGVAAVAILVLLRNAPPDAPAATDRPTVSVRRQLVDVLSRPASLLGFWVHWMCSFWVMVFALMWGYPFLLHGLGYPQPVAAGLFTVLVVAGLPLGPLVGLISRRGPLQRTNLAFLVSLLAAVPWLAVLLWPGVAPVWLLVLLMIGMAAAGPGSNIGFDVVRSTSPGSQMGTASGLVIVGGFTAALINVLVIGVVLDHAGGNTLTAFRWAMATQFVIWGVGVLGAYTARGRARRLTVEMGVRPSLLSHVVRREATRALARLHLAALAESGPARPVRLAVAGGRTVSVVAVVPEISGLMVAIDLPPREATELWWRGRVDDYLALVAASELGIGSIEVRCPDAAAAAHARTMLAHELAGRGQALQYDVVVRR